MDLEQQAKQIELVKYVALCAGCEAVYTGPGITANSTLPCGHTVKALMVASLIQDNARDAELLLWAQHHASAAYEGVLDDFEAAGGKYDNERGGPARLSLP